MAYPGRRAGGDQRQLHVHRLRGGRHRIVGRWDLLIAHPPCTYLTAAGATNLFNADHSVKDWEREAKLQEAVRFFKAMLAADCEHIAVENPAPMKYCKLPPYTQIIEPYMCGDPWKKRTCLWLKGLPKLRPDDPVQPLGCWVQEGGRTTRTKLNGVKGVRSAKLRSKTFPGIARAMAEQWTAYLRDEPADQKEEQSEIKRDQEML